MLSPRIALTMLAGAVGFAAGCTTPLHLTDSHVTSAPRPPAVDVGVLVCQRVATLGPAVAPGLQGMSPTVSYALATALSKAEPPIRTMPMAEMLNRLSDQGLGGEYSEVLAAAGRGGILDRDRLRRIGAALGSRYVLQPGLAEFSQTLVDKFEFAGLKMLRTRMAALRLWLQLWDAQSGHLLWESTGEVTVSAPVVAQGSTVSLDAIAQGLWSTMLKDELLATKTPWPRCPGA
jgi:hypothetical protein